MSAETTIRFAINPDGTIASMKLESSDHKDSFNRAAWGAITGVHQFPPLPSEFTGPDLQLRIRFSANKRPVTPPTPIVGTPAREN